MLTGATLRFGNRGVKVTSSAGWWRRAELLGWHSQGSKDLARGGTLKLFTETEQLWLISPAIAGL